MDFLSKLKIREADAQEILVWHRKYGTAVEQLAREYMSFAPKVF